MKNLIDQAAPPLPTSNANLSASLFLKQDIEKYLGQLNFVVTLSPDERQHLGKLLYAGKHEFLQQLDNSPPIHGLDSQQLNTIQFNNAELTQHEKDAINQFQPHQTSVASISGDFALGNILVTHGQITRHQLESALSQQKISGRRVGEELITAGHANIEQIERGLLLQRKLIACALAVAVGLTPIAMTSAEAAQANTTMAVSVTVVAHAKIQTAFQASQLKISKADITRGYVEVPAASRFSVVSNSRTGYLLEFYPIGNLFDSVQIGGMGNPIEMGADGGVIVQRGPLLANLAHELNFRFALRPDVVPGTYPWPLQLSVRTL